MKPKKWMGAALVLLFFLNATSAAAKPARKKFYEGPYLTLSGGLMQFDWDRNNVTGGQEGYSWEPTLGLGFGWNIRDYLAPELLLRYTTDKNNGRREYIVGANVGLTLTWISDRLTNFKEWRILPFLKPGFALQVAALPGNNPSTNEHLVSIGFGPSIGAGVRFLYRTYLYFGAEVQEEFLRQQDVFQSLPNSGSTKIYNGGWVNQFETFLMVGVHF